MKRFQGLRGMYLELRIVNEVDNCHGCAKCCRLNCSNDKASKNSLHLLVLMASDARDMNLPPIYANFQHPSAMISMSTGDLVPSRAPCPYNLKTNKSKHWQSLCDTCNISYACTTRHAILRYAYNAFNGQNLLVKGLRALIERYVTSTTAHHTPQSSNRIGCDHNPSFGLRSCWKHVTSHSSVQKTSIHLWASP